MIIDQILAQHKLKPTSYKQDSKSERPMRSIVKTVSWRMIGTIDTIFISWMVTGAFALAFSIGAIELVTKMILYFFHERVWNAINWGKQ